MLTVTNKVVLVDVPEGAYGVRMSEYGDNAIVYRISENINGVNYGVPHTIDLPPGISVDWAKLATEVSEQEAAELVDRVGQHFKDYSALDDPKAQWWVRNPLHSLHYLMVSHYHDPNKTIVVKIKM